MKHRIIRVRELFKRELSTILRQDFEFVGMLITVVDVDVTPDMKQAFVYIGVIGESMPSEKVLKDLNLRKSSIQRGLINRLTMKYIPQLEFRLDVSAERGVRLNNIIDSLNIPEDEDIQEEVIKE